MMKVEITQKRCGDLKVGQVVEVKTIPAWMVGKCRVLGGAEAAPATATDGSDDLDSGKTDGKPAADPTPSKAQVPTPAPAPAPAAKAPAPAAPATEKKAD